MVNSAAFAAALATAANPETAKRLPTKSPSIVTMPQKTTMTSDLAVIRKLTRFRSFVLMIMSAGGQRNFDSGDEFLRAVFDLFMEFGDED